MISCQNIHSQFYKTSLRFGDSLLSDFLFYACTHYYIVSSMLIILFNIKIKKKTKSKAQSHNNYIFGNLFYMQKKNYIIEVIQYYSLVSGKIK